MGDNPTPLGADRDGCDWPVAAELSIEKHWRSGYYEVLLEINVDGRRRQSHAFFVVRPRVSAPTATALLALSTNKRLQGRRMAGPWSVVVRHRDQPSQ